MIGPSGNRGPAERAYNKMVKEQIAHIYDFQTRMETLLNRLKKEEAVEINVRSH